MEILLIIFLWLLIGGVSGGLVHTQIDRDDLTIQDLLVFSIFGAIMFIAAIIYTAIHVFSQLDNSGTSNIERIWKNFWRTTLIKRRRK